MWYDSDTDMYVEQSLSGILASLNNALLSLLSCHSNWGCILSGWHLDPCHQGPSTSNPGWPLAPAKCNSISYTNQPPRNKACFLTLISPRQKLLAHDCTDTIMIDDYILTCQHDLSSTSRMLQIDIHKEDHTTHSVCMQMQKLAQ